MVDSKPSMDSVSISSPERTFTHLHHWYALHNHSPILCVFSLPHGDHCFQLQCGCTGHNSKVDNSRPQARSIPLFFRAQSSGPIFILTVRKKVRKMGSSMKILASYIPWMFASTKNRARKSSTPIGSLPVNGWSLIVICTRFRKSRTLPVARVDRAWDVTSKQYVRYDRTFL